MAPDTRTRGPRIRRAVLSAARGLRAGAALSVPSGLDLRTMGGGPRDLETRKGLLDRRANLPDNQAAYELQSAWRLELIMNGLSLMKAGRVVVLGALFPLSVLVMGPSTVSAQSPPRVRTAEARFANLKGYPFPPHYADINGLRMHYVDEGQPLKGTMLLVHGEPSWSYLYRNLIPVFVKAGYRVIAPDMIGFGKRRTPTGTRSMPTPDSCAGSSKSWICATSRCCARTGAVPTAS